MTQETFNNKAAINQFFSSLEATLAHRLRVSNMPLQASMIKRTSETPLVIAFVTENDRYNRSFFVEANGDVMNYNDNKATKMGNIANEAGLRPTLHACADATMAAFRRAILGPVVAAAIPQPVEAGFLLRNKGAAETALPALVLRRQN